MRSEIFLRKIMETLSRTQNKVKSTLSGTPNRKQNDIGDAVYDALLSGINNESNVELDRKVGREYIITLRFKRMQIPANLHTKISVYLRHQGQEIYFNDAMGEAHTLNIQDMGYVKTYMLTYGQRFAEIAKQQTL